MTAENTADSTSAPETPSVPRPSGAVPKPGPRPGPKPGPPKPAVPRQATSAGGTAPAKPGKPGKPAPAASAAPRVTLIPATEENVFDAADDAVDALLEAGTEPGSILVLTTGGPHPWQQHEETFGAAQYWRQYDEGKDVFYASLPASRPLRRAAVVVVVNGFAERDSAAQILTAALTAGASVTVCGDIELVRALTGVA
ncbi:MULTISPECIES: hypothetical protein [unclassified Embleya]|uniref:hypothetical protein n=1 Tax=unclassified Embleya TaxID=2699296 RepID=UPI0033C7790D